MPIGITASAGPGRTIIAMPREQHREAATTKPTRTISERPRWRSRCARRRSTNDGFASLIPLR